MSGENLCMLTTLTLVERLRWLPVEGISATGEAVKMKQR